MEIFKKQICHTSPSQLILTKQNLIKFSKKKKKKKKLLSSLLLIGDLGMVREIGWEEDGLEGDNRYMAPELLNLNSNPE